MVDRRHNKSSAGSPMTRADEDNIKAGSAGALTKAYKQDSSIENYLQLRRAHPNVEIEVSLIGGLDQLLYMEAELKRFGIDPELLASVIDADRAAISEMALLLLEKLADRKRKVKNGGTHLSRRGRAIPDKLVDWIIASALDALSWNYDLHIPRDLIVLIRERLCGTDPDYERASRLEQKRRDAESIGAKLFARGVRPSFRRVAQVLGVQPSTVKRWFPKGDFFKRAELLAMFLDETGEFAPRSVVAERAFKRSEKEKAIR